MDAHIASCPICYEVFAETVRFALDEQDEEEEDARRRRKATAFPFVRGLVRRRPFQAAAALAAAASLLLAFHLWRERAARPSPPLLAELAEAVGPHRFVEPRLTGGFRHGRLTVLRSDQSPDGLDAYPGGVLAAVARIRERAEAFPSPEALGALGVTYLVSGDLDAAVKALESATAQAPDDPGLRSDLAAAYLARASRLDDPSDLPKALDAAERAIALDSAPDEAWFNRALALEKLHLLDAARKAWQDYLERDAASGWADEARRHLEDLPADKQSSLEEERSRVRAALQEGEGAVDRLAREAPATVRDFFQDELLPAWAEAHAAGQPNAEAVRDQATLVGDALLESTGDALARDAARVLPEPTAGASRGPPHEQALGFLAYRAAQRLYDAQQPSCAGFRDARRLLEEGGSPYALRARERAVWACLYPAESRAGLAELARIETAAAKRGFRDLLGRVRWLQSLFLWHRGDLTSAMDRMDLARAAFRGVGDTDRESLAFAGLAESFHTLGDGRRAWRARAEALRRRNSARDPRWRHSILEEAALACVDEHLPRAAFALQAAVVEAARRWSNALAMSDALLRRATMHQALDATDPAAADVAEARRWIAQIGDEAMRKRFQAEAEAVEGEGLADAEPGQAAERLGNALAYFDTSSPVRVPRLRHLLARTHAKRGQLAEAERELLAAIEALESQRASLDVATLQASFFDQAASLFDEMVDLQVKGLHDPERALAFVERGRARQLADALAGPVADAAAEAPTARAALPRPLQPAELRRALPEGVALVCHASRDDRLLSWVLTRDASRFVERPTTGSELGRLVAAHVAAVEERAALPVVRARAARLHDELVRPLAPFIRSSLALVFVGDHTLSRVAFASLWDREAGRYLVEDHLVGLAPSGTVFVRATAASTGRADGPAPAALVVGNPRLDPEMGLPSLPEAEREATDVARLYARSERLTGSAATKAAFLERLPESRVVHFAGHGASGDVPWSARLHFAPDPPDRGALFLHELDGRSLPHTRLVVLAACHTAAGAPSSVEGALSLARPFLAAGVPNVVGSLWAVDDAVGRRFFVAFHRHLLDGGEPVLALRRTQLSLLGDGDPVLSHPASWASFVALGGLDPRTLATRPGPAGP
jgi:CHAT domain-containing protein/tetratricopeptide (TPR) repeat protein